VKNAEIVTFGGSGLDRAAQLRDKAAQTQLKQLPVARSIVMWRGKPAVIGDTEAGGQALLRIPLNHPALQDSGFTLFLGRDGGRPIYAADLSSWTPAELPGTLDAFSDPSEQRHPALPDAAFVELRGIMTSLSARDAELAATARGLMEWHRTHSFCANCGESSQVTLAGWQRLCPACGRHHFPRTDPVAIMLITRGNSVLLGRSPGWPDGMYSLLAGFVEPGETIEAAVRREVYEEAGIHVGEVSYLASQPWPFPASLMIGCHGIATSHDIRIDPTEIEDARWMTREDLMQAQAGEHDVKPARPGAIAHFLLSNWLADRLD